MLILKIAFLFLAVTYGFCYIGRLVKKRSICGFQTTLMALGITGFVTLQWLI